MRIDTQPPGQTPEDEDGMEIGPTDNPPTPELEKALEQLREAAETRQVEPICQAYAALCGAADHMPARDLLALAGQRLDLPAAGLVISAYSHLRCYMCDEGTIVCDACEGTCQDADGHPCLQCDGLGLTPCGFCGGTGWADRGTIPPELAKAVAKRQLVRVQADLAEVQKLRARLGPEQVGQMSLDRRGALAGRLIRLQARLEELGRHVARNDKQAAYVADLADKVGAFLETLRR